MDRYLTKIVLCALFSSLLTSCYNYMYHVPQASAGFIETDIDSRWADLNGDHIEYFYSRYFYSRRYYPNYYYKAPLPYTRYSVIY